MLTQHQIAAPFLYERCLISIDKTTEWEAGLVVKYYRGMGTKYGAP